MQHQNSTAERRALVLVVEELGTGRRWKAGLTWSDYSAATRALQAAQRSHPGVDWVLREVGQPCAG